MYQLNLYLIKLIRIFFDASACLIGPRKQPSLQINDVNIAPGLKVRVYSPAAQKPLPVIIYYHGGGWIIGGIKSYDRILQYLSHHSSCIVVAVEYRKAPEHKAPTALDDCYFAYQWVMKNIASQGGNKNKICLAGDSAGGNIATHIAAKKGAKVKCMVLIYPLVDVTPKTLKHLKAKQKLSLRYGYMVLNYVLKQYLPNYNSLKSISSPAIKIPKVLIIAAETDILLPTIKQYKRKLELLGTKVDFKLYKNTVHGFVNFAGISAKCRRALDDIAAFIKHI